MDTYEIDLETGSGSDIKHGVYKYVEDKYFDIYLFGISINGGPVRCYDLSSGEKLPEEIIRGLVDDNVIKWAFNASFERICISTWLCKNYPDIFKSYGSKDDSVSKYLSPVSWRCSMVLCAYNGLPLSLESAGAVLGFDKQKLKEGKDLIRYFCCPCKPTKTNGGRTWNRPSDAPEKWALFKKYNIRDVEVEMQITQRLSAYMVPDSVWEQYQIDQMINDRGILVDKTMVEHAIELDAIVKEDLTARLKDLTHLDNPNSVAQLKKWLSENDYPMDSLAKKEVEKAVCDAPEPVKTVLLLHLQLAKSSVKKYNAMLDSACDDNRCRGMFQFYGANRSGRWAGRIVQLQNLPQNHLNDLDAARTLVRAGDYDTIGILYYNVPDVLSQLIRTAFIAKPGYKFVVSDFSAIEARVLSHLAGEKWRSKVFEEGGDIYCASASQMFKVPVEKHGINGHLRQKGKIAELALGYGGSVGALTSMGALDMGLKEEELQPLVNMWRDSNPHIVAYWWQIDKAVKDCIRYHINTSVGCVKFCYKAGMLFIGLPSGRRLSYVKPRMGINRFGGESIEYYGIGENKKWMRIESYGPKIVENITQAISRDILCYAMHSLKDLFICAHIHDELVIEVPEDTDMQTICDIMGRTPPWLPGIKLRADGYETPYYKKD